MEHELNYLSRKAEEIELNIIAHDNVIKNSEDADEIRHYVEAIEVLNEELEMVNNILNIVTQYTLK